LTWKITKKSKRSIQTCILINIQCDGTTFDVWEKEMNNFVKHVRLSLQNTSLNCSYINDIT
jgi:hypothetical protein